MAVVLSQILIFLFWKDAKYGTIANGIILLVALYGWADCAFTKVYQQDVALHLAKKNDTPELVSEEDLDVLPKPVQNYLNYAGVVGKPKIKNFKITFEGEMRDKGKDWFPFTSEQYNFIKSPARLFFMKAKVSSLPTLGYHKYADKEANMRIKLLSFFTVVNIDSPEMFPTETVTFFNDMCLFAPSALIDSRIQWEEIGDLSAKALFTNGDTSISAILYFNEKGQLVNFISNDRYSVSEMKAYPFSTPVKDYKQVNGFNLPSYGEAVWQYPDGDFVYGKFNIKSIEYNIEK